MDGDTSAFRPLAEALQSLARASPLPGLPAAYQAALGRLVPEWRPDGWDDADFSLVLLGEAVLRLLGALGDGPGLLLILADLHWADPETLAVVEYLADNLAPKPVALVSSVRSEQSVPALRLVRALAARRSASVHALGRLDEAEVERMARACLREALEVIGREARQRDALLGREDQMRERIGEALRLAGGDPEMEAFALAGCDAYLALHREDLDGARRVLERAMEITRRTGGPPRPFRGLWALMRALAGDGGDAAVAEVVASGATVNQGVAGYVGYAEAVLLGRAGRGREAEAAFDRAEERMAELRWWQHARRLLARTGARGRAGLVTFAAAP
ncbi:MAG TPA: hypothetical protein VKG45_01635 [Actinomycetes bacterium]|nr:hypothetical protein [Actinomycetes bacterium]